MLRLHDAAEKYKAPCRSMCLHALQHCMYKPKLDNFHHKRKTLYTSLIADLIHCYSYDQKDDCFLHHRIPWLIACSLLSFCYG